MDSLSRGLRREGGIVSSEPWTERKPRSQLRANTQESTVKQEIRDVHPDSEPYEMRELCIYIKELLGCKYQKEMRVESEIMSQA